MELNLEKLNIITLNAGYAELYKEWNFIGVRSPFARLYYVTKGSAKVVFENFEVRLYPSHLYLIPPFTIHDELSDGLFCHYYVHIYERHDASFKYLEEIDFPVEAEAQELDLPLFVRLLALNPQMSLKANNPATYDNQTTLLQNIKANALRPLQVKMESQGILRILLSRFMDGAKLKHNITDGRIKKAIEYVHDKSDSPVSLSSLADVACMSRDHFIRVFKQQIGLTPTAYIIKYKMEQAELLLLTTARPVQQIAEQLGYFDHAYFNRIFKKTTGKTPLEYRKSVVRG